MKATFWTPEKDALLVEAWQVGRAYADIANHLGITKNDCISRGQRLGLKRDTSRSLPNGRFGVFLAPPTKRKTLKGRFCHFIAGEPRWYRYGDAIFCGVTPLEGSDYCDEHHAICFVRYMDVDRNKETA